MKGDKMKQKTVTRWFNIIVLLFLMLLITPLVLADEKEDFVKSAGFSYDIKFPDNQVGKKQGALSLEMEANQQQRIPIVFTNLGENELTLSLVVTGARTNVNGLIEYGPNEFSADESLAYDITDLVTLPEEVTIPGNGQETVDFQLAMPEVPFEGIVLGGVQIMSKDKDVEKKYDKMVVNKFARLFGVTLNMGRAEVKPNLSLKKVYPGIQNYTSAIFLDIANVTPTKIEGLTTEIDIQHKTNSLVSYNSRKNNMEMAPNSIMNYFVSLDSEPMVAGDYEATVKVYNSDHKWEWMEEFTISEKDADKFNKDNVSLVQERKFDWKIIVIGTVSIIAVLCVLYITLSIIRKKKSTSDKKIAKKRKKVR